MDRRELELIKELMDKLSEEMEYGEEDFSERLGRKKPHVEVIKMEGKMPMDEDLEHEEEELGMDLDGDMEMDEDPEHIAKVLGRGSHDEDDMEESSPESDLKRRLMKLRR